MNYTGTRIMLFIWILSIAHYIYVLQWYLEALSKLRPQAGVREAHSEK